MEVDFNGLRSQIAEDYNSLVSLLDIAEGFAGLLLVSPERLERRLGALRSSLNSLMLLSETDKFRACEAHLKEYVAPEEDTDD